MYNIQRRMNIFVFKGRLKQDYRKPSEGRDFTFVIISNLETYQMVHKQYKNSRVLFHSQAKSFSD